MPHCLRSQKSVKGIKMAEIKRIIGIRQSDGTVIISTGRTTCSWPTCQMGCLFPKYAELSDERYEDIQSAKEHYPNIEIYT